LSSTCFVISGETGIDFREQAAIEVEPGVGTGGGKRP
jgi:hypothetical protein